MPFPLKKTTLLALSSLLAFAFSSSSFADSCDSLLNAGIYNVTQSSSAEDSQSLLKSTFCSADYSNTSISSSQQAAIKASYGGFGGGASGSTSSTEIITKQSQVCTSGFNSSSYSNQASDYSKTVYQGSLDAWNQCQALANRGVIFESQFDSGLQGVTVTLSTPAGASSKFLGMSQMGTGRFLCRTTLPARGTSLTGKLIVIDASTAFTFDSASKLIINCQRQMRLDAVGNLNADAQTLVFNTSAGAYQVPMAAIGAMSRTSFDKAQAHIMADVKAQLLATRGVLTIRSATFNSRTPSSFNVGSVISNTLLPNNPLTSDITIPVSGNYIATTTVNTGATGANSYTNARVIFNGTEIAGAYNTAHEYGSATATASVYAKKGDVISGKCDIDQGVNSGCSFSLALINP